MRIYLLQHGEAVAKEIDPARPLSDKGRKEVSNIAKFVMKENLDLKRILHSGKLRASQTAEIWTSVLLQSGVIEEVSGISPNDPVDQFIPIINTYTDNTLIVGHLPLMACLVSHLLTGDANKKLVDYQPGSIICLVHICEEQWILNWMIRPPLG